MSEVVRENKSLLHLPVEILGAIIRHVPRAYQHSVSEACKKLHEISCDVIFHELRLEAYCEPESVGVGPIYHSMDSETTLNSLLTQRRRYSFLDIRGAFSQPDFDYPKLTDLQVENLVKILKRFGYDIKYLSIWSLDMNGSLAQLLNLMPNLEGILLGSVRCSTENVIELNLKKLEEIDTWLVCDKDLNLFKTLPSGVLRKLAFSDYDYSGIKPGNVRLYPNQHNIDVLKIEADYAVNLDYEKLKLKSFRWCSILSTDFAKIIKTQYELKKLRVEHDMEDMKIGGLKTICNQLTSLEELHLKNAARLDASEIADFSKLKMLKKLRLAYYYDSLDEQGFNPDEQETKQFNDLMSFLKSDSLVELDLDWIPTPQFTEETLTQLAANLPQLNMMRKTSDKSYFTELSAIMRNFPTLDCLQYCGTFAYLKCSDSIFLSCNLHNQAEFDECVTYTQGDDVTELELDCSFMSVSKIEKLAAHFPQVKNLSLLIKKESHLGFIIRSFPKLESLIYEFESLDFLNYQDDLENQSLKELSIKGSDFNEDLAKIVGCCKKLEELTIQGLKNAQMFQGILKAQQNLKSLTLDSCLPMSEEIMNNLKNHANNLNFFDFKLAIDNSFPFEKVREFINQKFKKDFEVIELRSYWKKDDDGELLRLKWKMSRLSSPPVMGNTEGSHVVQSMPKKMKMSLK